MFKISTIRRFNAGARSLVRAVTGLSLALMMAGSASAQSNVTRIIVPLPPGGVTDGMARLFAARMSNDKEQFIVENRPGGNQIIAVQALLSAPADGRTLFFSSPSGVSTNVALMKALPYDPLKDLTPVARIFQTPTLLVTSGKSPHRTVADVVAASKKRQLNVATAAPGQTIQYEFLRKELGIQSMVVLYKGSAPALQDVISEVVDLHLTDPHAAYSLIQAGTLRALAILNDVRDPNLPDVPTVAEVGATVPPIYQWTGVFLKAGTPQAVVREHHARVARFVKDPAVIDYTKSRGVFAFWGDAEALREQQRSDIKAVAEMMKNLGMDPQ